MYASQHSSVVMHLSNLPDICKHHKLQRSRLALDVATLHLVRLANLQRNNKAENKQSLAATNHDQVQDLRAAAQTGSQALRPRAVCTDGQQKSRRDHPALHKDHEDWNHEHVHTTLQHRCIRDHTAHSSHARTVPADALATATPVILAIFNKTKRHTVLVPCARICSTALNLCLSHPSSWCLSWVCLARHHGCSGSGAPAAP
jgi:hypothetical protein